MILFNKDFFSEYFKNAREKAGISQIDLAKALGYSSPQYVSNWERGICSPPINKLEFLCKALNLDPNKLMDVMLEHVEKDLSVVFKLEKAGSGKKRRSK